MGVNAGVFREENQPLGMGQIGLDNPKRIAYDTATCADSLKVGSEKRRWESVRSRFRPAS
jgi:hypothetical protein